jgi:alpha-glucosidase
VLDEFASRVLIGEIYLPLDRLMAYYGTDLDGVQLPFNFQLLQSAWNARRIAARVGLLQARVAAVLLLTLRGTPTLYYGDELGMADVPIAADRVRDHAMGQLAPCRIHRWRAMASDFR